MMVMLRQNFSIPVVVLLAANIFPLYGVLELGWGVFELIFLFWMENVVIGLFNIFKLLASRPNNAVLWLGKLFFVPFFTFHYGIFTLVHGVFVIALFGPEPLKKILADSMDNFSVISDLPLENSLATAVLLLAVSHAVSFYFDYIRNGEYERAGLQQLMSEPYRRVVVLHVGLIASGFLLMSLDQPTAGLILLVFLKIALDAVGLLRREKGA
jgi:hypothetical protein